ncbi:glycosyl transferase [Lentilactobacillus curieae]|uniref:Glycosyl transferase n=1 Tax=Lentilactobacillus curieae TaxID=1138822 RepID=A0A1S6QGQ1_9LACO|nr:glycosyltransferase family A protein [Lentilactobacillus curieae]AQW20780.1 glycosyl transferase [Lentilactobacillus curieae]
MNDSILMTVVVPTHNLENYVGKTLDSLANQQYRNFEVIVVDDASTDKTVAVAERYVKLDPRFRVVKLTKHSGVSKARNAGIDDAKVEAITFVDGDDLVEPDFLQVMADGMAEPKVDMVTVGYRWGFRGAGALEHRGLVSVSKREVYDSINTRGNLIGGYVWNKAFRVSVLREKQIRFDETLDLAEDLLFTADYVYATNNFLLDAKPLYEKVSRPGSTIHSASFKQREREYEVRQHIDDMGAKIPS